MPTLQRGDADAGVIIHESRFTYREAGFHEILDLGAWWEEDSGLPIPLGGILARRDLMVIDAHIELYVNDFSLNLGEQGVAAVEVLMTRAEERGLISKSAEPLFLT